MRKIILCAAIFFAILIQAHAQEYYTGIGLRWGKINSGITLKHFFNADNATGAQFDIYRSYVYNKGWTAKVFFIKQASFRLPLLQIPLDYIYGFGLHAGYFPYNPDPTTPVRNSYGYFANYFSSGNYTRYTTSVVTIGIDATLQIEYAVPMHDLPITVSIDANPWFEFLHRGPEYMDYGISVRWVFK